MAFDVAVRKRLGETVIAAEFVSGPGITILFGPSGVGKTSVLNMVAGLLTPDAGHLRVDGAVLFDAAQAIDEPVERRGAGYVFQDARLFPHRRVRDNLRYGMPRAPDAAFDFDTIVAILGIAPLLDRWPRALSGGEARRVAIGRALLRAPRFLLMDEPLASLDRARRGEIMTMIERIRDDLALPMLYVTHDPEEAERLATTIVAMERA